MKDLDKMGVYDLRGATSEQLEELLNWLRARQRSWYDTDLGQLAQKVYVRFDGDHWVTGSCGEPSIHISTLFEEGEFLLPEKWCVRGGADLHNYFTENKVRFEGKHNNKMYYMTHKGRWNWEYDENLHRNEITFEQFKKYVLKENEMKTEKLIITRQALSEIYTNVCHTWQNKIEGILSEGLFKEEFEVMPHLVEEAYKACDTKYQKEWLKKYLPKPEKKMELISCLQDGSDVWAVVGYPINPLCTYERIQSYKDGLDVILKTDGNSKTLYLGYWNDGKI